ncbi:hypothetical protein [Paraburkholderia sp. GAS38]|uniref:hypothetical protein n=1 Tax=Paraburkholderia sp. GAS38 TaxID=3035133 RepID=UPI003D1A23A2
MSFHDAMVELPDGARAGRAACAEPAWGVLVQAQRTTTVNPVQHLRIQPIMKASLVCDVVRPVVRRHFDSRLLDITFGAFV